MIENRNDEGYNDFEFSALFRNLFKIFIALGLLWGISNIVWQISYWPEERLIGAWGAPYGGAVFCCIFGSLIGWTFVGAICGIAIGGITVGLKELTAGLRNPNKINYRKELDRAKELLGEAKWLPGTDNSVVIQVQECLERIEV